MALSTAGACLSAPWVSLSAFGACLSAVKPLLSATHHIFNKLIKFHPQLFDRRWRNTYRNTKFNVLISPVDFLVNAGATFLKLKFPDYFEYPLLLLYNYKNEGVIAMEERFDLSWKNKEVRVWIYFMLPIALLTITLSIVFDATSLFFPLALFIPFISGLCYRWWRNAYRKKTNHSTGNPPR